MTAPRFTTESARLARLGFTDPGRAAALFAAEPLSRCATDEVVTAFGEAADPDSALLLFSRILDSANTDPEVMDGLCTAVKTQPSVRAGLCGVLGVSQALGDHLVRHPQDWPLLGSNPPQGNAVDEELLAAVGANSDADMPVADLDPGEASLALRRAYRRELLQITRRDVVDGEDYERVVAALSAAADAALEAALAIARAEVGDSAQQCRFAVIAMGKCGGMELNYISDVDVIFVVEPVDGDEQAAIRTGTALASSLMRICAANTPEGTLWEVDPGLRPEGKAGALVRTLASHVGYYERWAQTWEFQALLKARTAAGDRELGRRYVDATSEFVWQAASRTNFVEDVQAMRRRVEESVRGKTAQRQLKLGKGGLRDVEFSVQLLQLVHGRSDVLVRSPNTMAALEALANYGYVGRGDASGLASAYKFLRTLEHRLQLWRLKRVHVVPDSAADLRRIARSLGFRSDPLVEFDKHWRAQRLEVRRLHEKLFYRPLLQAVARLEAGEARLTAAQAGDRLEALGFTDPDSALVHLEALTSGVSRRAAIQRTLLPVLLSWFADKPDPDMALLGFRRVSDALGSTPWYLRLLRDESAAAARLAELLGSSRYSSDLLIRAPEAVSILGSTSELSRRPLASLESAALSSVNRHQDSGTAMGALRAFRRRELLRTSVADLLHLSDVEEVCAALTDIAAATVTAALQAAVAAVAEGGKLAMRFLVVGMGRFGGAEMSYSSDADVMFVYDPLPGADEQQAGKQALAVANELRRLLALPSPDPELALDADLRPEGRNGPLVRSLASYRAYYGRWSSPWESQALLRARRIAGDPDLGAQFDALIAGLRYPEGGLAADHLREMRRLKARMESERLPRGADPARHVKMGPGGLADVEWSVQLLQMQHSWTTASLTTTRTLPALRAAQEAGLIDPADAQILAEAWQMASRIRNATMLATGRASDLIPRDPKALATVAYLMGYRDSGSQQLLEDYRRTTRRCRKVVDRVFYGQ